MNTKDTTADNINSHIEKFDAAQKKHDRGFQFRALKEEDWEFIPDWYEHYDAEHPEREFLPHNGLGGFLISTPARTPVAILFLWETNSSTAIVAEMISNWNYKRDDKQEALTALVVFTTKMAELKGFKWAFGWGLENRTLKHYEAAGYGKAPQPSYEVSKKLI